MSVFSNRRGITSNQPRPTSSTRRKDSKRRYALERLEDRRLLAYNFTYGGLNNVTLTGDAVANTLVINESGGFLEYNLNGAGFTFDWDPVAPGVQQIQAVPATTVTVNNGATSGSAIQLGNPTSAASNNLAKFNLNASANNNDSLTIDDSTSPLGPGVYTYNGATGVISGPTAAINVQEGANPFGGGVTLTTGPAANTVNVVATFAGEPLTINGGGANDTVNVQQANAINAPVVVDAGGGAGNIVNIGNAGFMTLNSPVTVNDQTGSTTLNLDDQNDTNPSATITSTSVTGLSTSAINYNTAAPAGVTALNVNGGPGAGGVVYNVNSTNAATVTTLNGGANGDIFNIGNGNLDLLPGSVTVDGGGGSNTVFVNDQAVAFGDTYTITNNSLNRTVFGGLNYTNVSALTLNAEGGGPTVNVDSTAAATPVTVNLQGSNNLVNVGGVVGSGNLDVVNGLVTVNGPGGPATNNVVNVNDETNAFGDTYTVTSTTVNRTPPGLFGGLVYNSVDALNLNTEGGGPTTNIDSTAAGTPVTVNLQGNGNTVNVGNATLAGGLDNLPGAVTVNGPAGGASNSVNLNDQDANFNDNYTITPTTVSRIFFGGLTYNNIQTLTLNAENTLGTNGNNTIDVNGTAAGTVTNVNALDGDDIVNVTANSDVVNIDGGSGANTVNIGNAGSLTGINGPINVTDTGGTTDLNVDNSADPTASTTGVLDAGGALGGEIVNLAPSIISYDPTVLTSLTVTNGLGDDLFTVDFSLGNPLPTGPTFGTPAFNYNGGGGVKNDLNIVGDLPAAAGGPGFADEVHNANGPTFGNMVFTDHNAVNTQINYTNVSSHTINDTANATNYTFNDNAFPSGTVNLVDGGAAPGAADTLGIRSGDSPAAFVDTNVANKTNVTVATAFFGLDYTVNVNDPTQADGLTTLTVNTLAGGNDNVNVINTPPNVTTNVNTFSGNDQVSVLSAGIPVGTTTFLDGGAGNNDVLTYDADGQPFSALTFDPAVNPGFITIHNPVTGDVAYRNFEQVIITNVGAPVITTTPFPVNSVEGFQLVNQIVGSFTVADSAGAPIQGFAASDFTATIDWGDPSPDNTPGTIQQDAQNPSVFYVVGSHTFNEQSGAAGFPVTFNVNFNGGTIHTTPVAGVPVSVVFPAATGAGTTAAVVTQGVIAVSAFPITGVEGSVIPSGPIATFIDAGGADVPTDYTATIEILDSTGTVIETEAGTIAQNGTSAQYTVIAPDLTFPTTADEGTYTVRVTVTDTDTPDPVSSVGQAQAVIAEAPLTNVAPGADIAATEGTTTGTTTVATFTDSGGVDADGDYLATIDWGDGSTSTATLSNGGIVDQGAGNFSVVGDHNYHEEGAYTVTVVIQDGNGAAVSTSLTANVQDAALTANPASTLGATKGQPLNNVVLGTFTDANPFGTVSDFTASIDWGDGTITTGAVQLIGGTSTGSTFEVLGSHVYTTVPTTQPAITVTDKGGAAPITIDFTANVTEAPIAVNAQPVVGTEGTALAATPVANNPGGLVLVASFTDSNPTQAASSYTVTLDWGDGSAPVDTTSGVVVVADGGGVFSVFAPAHTYTEEGTYGVTVNVTSADPVSVGAIGVAIIGDADLTAGAAPVLASTTGATLTLGAADFTFTDANAGAPASDFTAVIDWGDGSPTSLGTISGSGGTYSVLGSHKYLRPGVFNITVNVADDGGETVTLKGTDTVTDAAVVAGNPVTIHGVEGQSTGTVVLGTFTDPNQFATASDVLATLSSWGDGTPGAPVPVAVTLIGSGPGGAVFQITGSHTYLEETAAAGVTITMSVTTSGGVTTPITATAIIADAPLSSSGATVTGVEGNTTSSQIIATFTDSDPNGTIADFTSGGGSVVVNWGDGSAPQTLTAADLTASGSPNGVVFTVTSTHLYQEAGTFAITVTIADAGGATTVAHGSAVIADAALAPSAVQPTVTATEGAPFTGAVASFTDGNPLATAADFNYVMINWGDGSPATAGVVSGPTGGPFLVSGTHTYANTGTSTPGAGTFPISVQVHDVDGATVTINNTATVNVASVTITGQLNPATDTGLSNNVANATFIQTPNFYGTVSPTSPTELVTLTATDGKGTSTVIGHAFTNAAGTWNITSVVLPQGTYTVTAVATDPTGNQTGGPTTIVSNLIVDTTGPQVANVSFNRAIGTIYVTYTDPTLPDGTHGSGISLPSILDAANYSFTRPHARANQFLITSITTVPTGVPGTETVAVQINNGRVIRGGFNFNFTIFAQNATKPSGVEDNAENAMDGEFYGTFPSGNNINGGNFNARLVAFHNRVLPPITNVGTAHPTRNPGAVNFARGHRITVAHAKRGK